MLHGLVEGRQAARVLYLVIFPRNLLIWPEHLEQATLILRLLTDRLSWRLLQRDSGRGGLLAHSWLLRERVNLIHVLGRLGR